MQIRAGIRSRAFDRKWISALLAVLAIGATRQLQAQCTNYGDYMRIIARVPAPDYARAVTVKNGIAYVGASTAIGVAGLRIVNVSNPSQPYGLGTLSGFSIYELALDGERLYGVDGQRALYEFDVSNPASPVIARQYHSILGTAHDDVALHGDYVYLASGTEMQVISRAADALTLVKSVPTAKYNRGIEVFGNYAFVAIGEGGVEIFDLSYPGDPKSFRIVDTPGFARDVKVANGRAYVADDNGVAILDVTNPEQAVLLGHYVTASDATHDVSIADATTVFIGAGVSVFVIDVSNPAAPFRRGVVTTYSGVYGLFHEYGTLYAADWNGGLVIVDAMNTGNVPVAGEVEIPGEWGLDVQSNFAYVCTGTGLQIVDVSNVGDPILRGHLILTGGTHQVAVSGHHAYVAAGPGDLKVVDVANPSAPALVTTHTRIGEVLDVAVQGNYAYLVDGFTVVDISNPANPVQVAVLPSIIRSKAVVVSGQYAYVADLEAGVVIVDVSVPHDPRRIASFFYPSVIDVYLSGNRLFVWNAPYRGVTVLDISNPLNPYQLGRLPEPPNDPPFENRIGPMRVEGNIAYAPISRGGLSILDITNPWSPVLIATSSSPFGAVDAKLANGYLFTSDWQDGLVIMPMHCSPTDAAEPDQIADLVLAPAWPNPTPGDVELRFNLGTAGPIRLEVFDVAGRRVRQVLRTNAERGQHVARWDGRDDGGTRVAAGCYLVRLTGRTTTATSRVTLLD